MFFLDTSMIDFVPQNVTLSCSSGDGECHETDALFALPPCTGWCFITLEAWWQIHTRHWYEINMIIIQSSRQFTQDEQIPTTYSKDGQLWLSPYNEVCTQINQSDLMPVAVINKLISILIHNSRLTCILLIHSNQICL